MKIVVFTSFFTPAFLGGGPIRTLAAMVRGAPPTFDTAVVTGNTDLGCSEPMNVIGERWVEHEGSRVFYCNARSWTSLFRGMCAVRSWQPDVVYVNSFFDARYSILPQFLFMAKFFLPNIFVIAPRGEFSTGALSIKGTKKRAYIFVFRSLRLHKRVLWHASTANEEHDIRAAVGVSARILVREDDTLLPSAAAPPKTRPEPGILRAVSLSRISPMKGVLTLLEGLQRVGEPVLLDIIGPAEDVDYSEQCHAAAAAAPANVRINFLGAKDPNEVRGTLAAYDVLLSPTRGENFGHVIAEALSVSCPVLCADVTPWTQVLTAGGGDVVTENTAAGWARAVESYARLSDTERFERRLAAGKAYEQWKSNSSDPHFFTLLQKHISP
ncbi:glycosyltransferase involved in cell wall biosynthesis [Pseudarthrobacter siccitolerans]|uniref:Glycosyltransferase involved in cell wall biosynthesis n=1 Tax=Pseudarthrobacter siccitolerans TaxID=861266 RepID=A0ABU0PJ21_9MICC|nr:glycosyltransferase [Pseudarthrobacter siccitolerans]MDQ0673960.1 glycosyltransferase involved in cell wall biosynthesis [Pseudarthrobacter siccitolerans]